VELDRLGRVLVVIGLVVVAGGALLVLLSGLGLGRLPGDLSIRRGNTHFYFPVASSIVISILLTVVLNLVLRK
jgi:Protein of unknown function (DUF2905)